MEVKLWTHEHLQLWQPLWCHPWIHYHLEARMQYFLQQKPKKGQAPVYITCLSLWNTEDLYLAVEVIPSAHALPCASDRTANTQSLVTTPKRYLWLNQTISSHKQPEPNLTIYEVHPKLYSQSDFSFAVTYFNSIAMFP